MADSKRRYSEQEMKEILHRALEREQEEDGITHEEMLAAASEIGVDRAAIDEAVADIAAKKKMLAQADAATESKKLVERDARRAGLHAFFRSLVTYLVIGGGLYFVYQRFPGSSWYFWMMLFWGIGVALQLTRVFFPHAGKENTRRARRNLERQARRDKKREAKRAMREGEAAFERAVTNGVAHLLSVAAKHIDEHVEEAKRRSSPRMRVDDHDNE